MSIAAVLFDLDGTLVDTAPDLVAVLNSLLTERGRPPMPYALARNEVSNGALGLIRLGFGNALTPAEIEALRRRFLELYASNVCTHSRLFIDLDVLFSTPLEVQPQRWGVVTNKPAAMTVPLLEQLGIASAAGCIVSGDSLPQRKPHPAPLLLAAGELGLEASQCVYVGDAIRDVEAGRAAGMRTIAALWGYIRADERPLEWRADVTIRHPTDLAGILRAWSPRP